MRRLPLRLLSFLPALVIAATAGAVEKPIPRAPSLSAYVPGYRLAIAGGAESLLGRPARDCSPLAWDGRIRADRDTRGLPVSWDERSWFTRLGSGFAILSYHVPLDTGEEGRWSGDVLPDGPSDFMRRLGAVWGRRIYLSFGGDSTSYGVVTADRETIREFAAAARDACLERGFDGVALDWEFPLNPDERDRYLRLARALREALDRDGLRLAVAVQRRRPQEDELYGLADEVRVMAYDGYGKHATYESAVADVENLASRYRIPRQKIFLGLPYYGRVWRGDHPEYWSGVMTYRQITEIWKPAADSDIAGDFYFNGPGTAFRKARWAAETGLGGIFVWEPFQDAPGLDSLTSALIEAIHPR